MNGIHNINFLDQALPICIRNSDLSVSKIVANLGFTNFSLKHKHGADLTLNCHKFGVKFCKKNSFNQSSNNLKKPHHEYAGFTTHSVTSGQDEKGQLSHHGSTSININQCIYHTFPLSVGTLPPSKVHSSPEPRLQPDHYCVGALRIITRTKAYTLSAHICSDIQVYTKNHTVIQYTGLGDVDFFPPCNCGNGPLLACHWWRYKLWTHRINNTPLILHSTMEFRPHITLLNTWLHYLIL